MTLHLTLTSWTQDHLTTLLKASTHPAFTTAFDALFAHTATFTLNGASVSRAEYAQRMFAAQDREHELSVVFPGALEIPNDVNDVLNGGEMGLIYHATIHFTKTVIGQPVTETVDASLNLLVEPDPTVLPGATDIDRRRVTSINELSQLKTGIIPL